MSIKVFRDDTVFFNEVFANGRGFFVFGCLRFFSNLLLFL